MRIRDFNDVGSADGPTLLLSEDDIELTDEAVEQFTASLSAIASRELPTKIRRIIGIRNVTGIVRVADGLVPVARANCRDWYVE